MTLTWIDVIALVVILVSTANGLYKGLVRGVFGLLNWIVAFVLSFVLFDSIAHFLEPYIHGEVLRYVVAFISIFLISLIVGGILTDLIGRGVYRIGLGGIDRLLGVLFGALRGILVVALLLLVGSILNLQRQEAWKRSEIVPYFQPLLIWMRDQLPKDLNPMKKKAASQSTVSVQEK